MRFWSKFVASWQHEIFLETKTKVCYMAKSLSVGMNFLHLNCLLVVTVDLKKNNNKVPAFDHY